MVKKRDFFVIFYFLTEKSPGNQPGRKKDLNHKYLTILCQKISQKSSFLIIIFIFYSVVHGGGTKGGT